MPNNPPGSAKTYSGEAEAEVGAAIGSAFTRMANKILQPFSWTVKRVSNWGIRFKVKLWLLCIVILPVIAALAMLETHPEELRLLLAVALVVAIVGFAPIAQCLSHLLITRELNEIEHFCARLKEGDYSVYFDLPAELENEHEIISLKRNLNWMAHVIAHRESWLHAALEGAHKDKDHYESLSNLDPLTGLANRRRLEEKLSELISSTLFPNQQLSLIFIDCDKFKNVNDTYGHQAGDQLLQRLADIIRNNVRKHVDLPFRYGGDEFGVVCVGLSPQEAIRPAERIRKQFLEHRLGDATLSVGVAGYFRRSTRSQAVNTARFIKAADQAAYQAKAQGGNRLVLAGDND